MSDLLTQAVTRAAEEVPGDLLELGARTIEQRTAWSPNAAAVLKTASPAWLYTVHADRIASAWRSCPDRSGSAVAWSIRAAVAAVAATRAENRVSLVWTGPQTAEVHGLRTTRAVLEALVEYATQTVMLVSYAGYSVQALVQALRAAVDRGVEVSLILETKDDSSGALSIDAAAAFAALQGRARFFRWPIDQRHAFFSPSARLHAKCAIADRSRALITSANLTAAAINDNVELGVLIEAGPLPATLHRHLSLLIEQGVFEEVV